MENLLNRMNKPADIHKNSLKGFLYSLAGAVLVSTNFVTAKYALKGFNPETFSLVWTSSAAFYALLIVFLTGHRNELKLAANTVSKVSMLGVATGVGMLLGWAGLSRLDPSFAAFIWRFAPVLTILLSALFLREKLTMIEIFPIAIMVLGGSLSAIGRWNIVGIGTALTLFACFATSLQMLIAKSKVREIHPNILVFYRVGIAAIIIAFWTFLSGKADFDVKLSYWLVLFLGAFLGPCVSFLFTFRSYRYWELSRSSIVLTAQPLFVLPLAYIFLHKIPAGKELLGGLIILIGAFWLAWIHLKSRNASHA